MAEQKEVYLNDGRFVEDGVCGSPFCRSGCHDNGAGKCSTDPVTIWQEVYRRTADPDEAAAEARQIYEQSSGGVIENPALAEECAIRAVTKRVQDVEVSGGVL